MAFSLGGVAALVSNNFLGDTARIRGGCKAAPTPSPAAAGLGPGTGHQRVTCPATKVTGMLREGAAAAWTEPPSELRAITSSRAAM